jgi:dienelactone hydrolase
MAGKRSQWAGLAALAAAVMLVAGPTRAVSEARFGPVPPVTISLVTFDSPNPFMGTTLTIEGKLSMPRDVDHPGAGAGQHGQRKLPAVLILHGSAGVDARGDFYQAALNKAGIATLQIDMWQARGYSAAQRAAAPILTYPDAFSALKFLSQQPAIDAARTGVLGFSWGGLVSMGAAETSYANPLGVGLRLKAHVAHYPVCYAWNNSALSTALHSSPAALGVQWLILTGAPVLIEVGTKDDYDNGSGPCEALAAAVNPGNGGVVSVNAYPGATHGWDRLMVPMVVTDPTANQGSCFSTGVVPTVHFTPGVDQAFESRARGSFLRKKLVGALRHRDQDGECLFRVEGAVG